MNKLRSDSHWSRLGKEQRERLDDWLFEDGLTYEEVLRRAKEELGVTASLSSLKRYRQWAAQKHLLYQLTDGTAIARCPKRADGARKYSHAMAWRLAYNRAMDLFLGRPGQEKDLVALLRMLIRNEAVTSTIQNMAKMQELQRDCLQFRRKIADFEVMKFNERNRLRARKMELEARKKSPPASASARVFSESLKNAKGGTAETAPQSSESSEFQVSSRKNDENAA